MTNQYDWLLKKTPRSVDAMKLWDENPRLDPDGNYNSITDIAKEMIANETDKKDFIDLVKSIANKGFIPADPIVLWQGTNRSFYVAEGNRRVLALKLLLKPASAPRSIKSTISRLSSQVIKASIRKIHVCIAPTFDDAEWYISQRNSISSLQRRWTSEQQRRWLLDLYEKYEGDINLIKQKIDLSEGELQKNIRVLKLKDYVKEIEDKLTPAEFSKATSFRFPISTFERFFNSSAVQKAWCIDYDGYNVKLNCNKQSFLNAFTMLIKRMILSDDDPEKIDSRSINTVGGIDDTLKSLPEVREASDDDNDYDTKENMENNDAGDDETTEPNNFTSVDTNPPRPKDDPNRPKLVDESYNIVTDRYRIAALFTELKRIPVNSYINIVASAIRIFLDLSVHSYIETENLAGALSRRYSRNVKDITLHEKLVFIQENKRGNDIIDKKLSRFLNHTNEFSLSVLNGYQHDNQSHHLDRNFLNRFWDFLLPLLQEFVDIKEENE